MSSNIQKYNNNNNNNNNNKRGGRGSRRGNRGRGRGRNKNNNRNITHNIELPKTNLSSNELPSLPYYIQNQRSQDVVYKELEKLCFEITNKEKKEHIVNTCLKFSGSTLKDLFPGTCPTSLTLAKLENINYYNYVFAVKADGIRVLMIILQNNIYFIDRKLSVFQLRDEFYYYNRSLYEQNTACSSDNTLFDGELVLSSKEKFKPKNENNNNENNNEDDVDDDEEDGEEDDENNNNFIFIVFDALYIKGQSITRDYPLFPRVNNASFILNTCHPLYNCSFNPDLYNISGSYDPNKSLSENNEENSDNVEESKDENEEKKASDDKEIEKKDEGEEEEKKEEEEEEGEEKKEEGEENNELVTSESSNPINFRIGIQRYYTIDEIERVLFFDAPMLSYSWDGLIFAPLHENYRLGVSQTVLKWKPHHRNTIDFLIHVVTGRQAIEKEIKKYQEEQKQKSDNKNKDNDKNKSLKENEKKEQEPEKKEDKEDDNEKEDDNNKSDGQEEEKEEEKKQEEEEEEEKKMDDTHYFIELLVYRGRETPIHFDWLTHDKGIQQLLDNINDGDDNDEDLSNLDNIRTKLDNLILQCWWDPQHVTQVPKFINSDNHNIPTRGNLSNKSKSSENIFSEVEQRLGGWKIQKQIYDRNTPTEIRLAQQISYSITDGISISKLISTCCGSR